MTENSIANTAQQEYWNTVAGPRWVGLGGAVERRVQRVNDLLLARSAVEAGENVLEIGCGTGAATVPFAEAVGERGRVVGVDISEPMLARAVRAEAGPQVGFLRADAQRLPLRDQTVDAVVSIAVLQLIPDPFATLSEIARVLRPGGRLAVMVPIVRGAPELWRKLPNGGAYVFSEDEIGDFLEEHGFATVRTKTIGTFQWVRAKRG